MQFLKRTYRERPPAHRGSLLGTVVLLLLLCSSSGALGQDPPIGSDAEAVADLLAAWGLCPSPCPFDLTGDGVVNEADLAALLAAPQPAAAPDAQRISVFKKDRESVEALQAIVPKALATQKGVQRSRVVDVSTEELTELDLQPGDRITLDLFRDKAYVGVIDRVDRRARDKYSWHGHLEGQAESSFDIVVEESVMVGNVHPEGELPLVIRFGGEEVGHVICEVAPDDTITCGVGPEHIVGEAPPVMPASEAPPAAPEESPPIAEDSGAFIDVLFVYTDGALTAAGGQSAIYAIIQLSVDTTNTAYSASNVIHRIRLAGRRLTNYNEGANTWNDHLGNITTDGDGIMDAVHDWRDDYGADLVALIVDEPLPPGGGTVGIAWVIGGASQEASGFSVTDQAFAANPGNWTVAHELGHNMGSRHNQQLGGTGITSYAFGHVFTGISGQTRGTIMAGPGRIQHFSNPDVNFDGRPTGIAIGQTNEADNRSAFAVSDSNVANYRQELPRHVWVQFDAIGLSFGTEQYPFRYMQQAEDLVRWNGTIHIKSSTAADGSVGTLGVDKAYVIVTENGPSVLD